MIEKEGERLKIQQKELQGNGSATAYLQTGMLSPEMPERSLPAIIICPGGAYFGLSEREAEPVAKEFFCAGYHVVILKYSVGEEAKNFRPLCQLAETIAWLRKNAAEWNIQEDKIAVCGFSAGGHLAASLGTLYNDQEFLHAYGKSEDIRPNAMILGYPVITADEFAHEWSLKTVSGAEPGEEKYCYFGLEGHVHEQTPPAFIVHTAEDQSVPVENSLSFAKALSKKKIPFELHILPKGAHGMSVCSMETDSYDPYNGRWVSWCLCWLNELFKFEK